VQPQRVRNSSGSATDVTMAKWSFVGTAARLWLPRGPAYGAVSVSVDGGVSTVINMHSPSIVTSAAVFEWAEPAIGTQPKVRVPCIKFSHIAREKKPP
jgi:hypothetical protein